MTYNSTNQIVEGGALHIVTYATHSEGTFDDLKKDMTNNKLDLHVVGWGEKWINYMQKLKSVRQHISKRDPKDVVIILDAFDTRMKTDRTAEYILNIYNVDFGGHGVVFSKNNKKWPFMPEFMSRYIIQQKYGGWANAGMYIGRAEDMLPVLDDAIKLNDVCKGDDQCGFNKLLHDHDIRIDEHHKLFKNLEYDERDQNIDEQVDTVFYGSPGTLTLSRLSRVPREFLPFIWREIVLMILVIVAIIVMLSKLVRSKLVR